MDELMYIPYWWTCPWCLVREMDKAGKYDIASGNTFHFSCWDDYQERNDWEDYDEEEPK